MSLLAFIGGRIKSLHTRGSVHLPDYLDSLDAAPPTRHWASGAKFGWWGNQSAGCCGIASHYDRRQLDAHLTGEAFVAKDPDDCYADYRAITGWDGVPGSPSDRGCQMIDVLNYAAAQGVAKERIAGFARLDPTNRRLMEIAINAFCSVYVGANLTKTVANDDPDVWDLPPIAHRGPDDEPDSTLGHAFLLTGYDRLSYDAVTWGRSREATNVWVDECVDEAYVILDDALVRGDRPAPSGLNLERLMADLARI